MTLEEHVQGSFPHIISADMKNYISEARTMAQLLKAKVPKQKKFC